MAKDSYGHGTDRDPRDYTIGGLFGNWVGQKGWSDEDEQFLMSALESTNELTGGIFGSDKGAEKAMIQQALEHRGNDMPNIVKQHYINKLKELRRN